jgi:hypothetical protein
MAMEDCDKSALYVETCKTNLYARQQTHPNSPDYSGKYDHQSPHLLSQKFLYDKFTIQYLLPIDFYSDKIHILIQY